MVKILYSWWWSQNEIALVLSRDVKEMPVVKILGGEKFSNFTVKRAEKRLYAKYSSFYCDGGDIHFHLSDKVFGDIRPVLQYFVCGDFNGWQKAVGVEKWRLKGNFPNLELSVPIKDLKLKRRTGQFKFIDGSGRWVEPRSDAINAKTTPDGFTNLQFNLDRTGSHIFVVKCGDIFDFCDDVRISLPQYGAEARVDAGQLLLQSYSNKRLGVFKKDGATVFSIFAPRASSAFVRWSRAGDDLERLVEAKTDDGAVWTATADSDIEGAFYAWHIDGKNFDETSMFNKRFPVSDPYALAMLTSSGPCIVKYEESLRKNDDGFTPPCWHDLVVMEAHLRDVLAHAPADISAGERLGFEGLAKWLSSPDCYLRRAGVNCVELQPIQEFTAEKRTDYEWGYMPTNWFSPSSSYASDPEKGTQNDDFLKLVKAFHKAGIAVILDVVYNHYGEPNPLLYVDKKYYFELSPDDRLMNYSGCGNDFRASSPMGKRMIIDSLKNLVSVYGVDGFRFDLAELLGVDVLKEIEIALKAVKPSVVLIAEPWSFRGHIAANLKCTGFTSWNDGFREFMLSYAKGGGNFAGFKYYIGGSMGALSSWPAQSVNYIESHDDMCLLDRITSRPQNPSVEDLRKYKIAYALILLSHGIPMLAEGFDLVRTKGGKNNTYKDGAANALDYRRAMRFTGECQWLRRLVKFRLGDKGRALRPDKAVGAGFFKFFEGDNSTASAVLFNASREMDAPRIFAAFNPTDSFADIATGDPAVKVSSFKQIADIDRFNADGIGKIEIGSAAFRHGVLTLPPISLSIWVD